MNELKRLFGTDGIRGIANKFPMTPELSLKLGKALVSTIKLNSKKIKIIIGKDTRLSGYIFEQSLAAGIASMGGDVHFVGPLPTPAISFITSSMRADAGIVISASHNPYQDNGIKIFDGSGFKLSEELELKIENLINSKQLDSSGVKPTDIGKAYRLDDAQGRYIVYLKNTFPKNLTLDGIKIVLDCSNGAAYRVAPSAFEELGANLIEVGVNPNGKNINQDCGALFPDLLKGEVLKHGADIGIALDGDADRVIFIDDKGNEVDGDKIIAIFAEEMINNRLLSGNTIVTTIMSNMALEKFVKDKGVNFIRTNVGDRYVVESMKNLNCNLGGEKSGHIIFLDYGTTGDGTLAALQILKTMIGKNKSLSELAKIIDLYPQTLLNVKIKNKKPLTELRKLSTLVNQKEKQLDGYGRINLRYSGTESILRVMVEGDNESLILNIAEEIADLANKELGI